MVSQSTHECGHTLPERIMLITYCGMFSYVYKSDVSFSDHSSVLFKLNHTNPTPMKITINRRSLSNIDFAAFNDDICSSLLF